jgi:diguanylate cyclase (GGDEF)-like protein/PAS domain S-box-containing protein
VGIVDDRLRAVIEASHEAFISMDGDGIITDWNPRAESTFGWSKEEAVGRAVAETIIPPSYRELHWRGLKQFLDTGEGPVLDERLELTALHRNGREFPVELTISALEEPGGWTFHAFLHDISERVTADAEREELLSRVEAMARTDELTGLANRRAWDEELRRELDRARRHGRPVCVAMLDLDRFKEFNDRHGHQAGDVLLKEAGEAWRLVVRVSDFVARYGGEEFAVLLPDCRLDEAIAVAERLRAAMPEGQTASVGVAKWNGYETGDDLVGRADGALYEAKRQGRDRILSAS